MIKTTSILNLFLLSPVNVIKLSPHRVIVDMLMSQNNDQSLNRYVKHLTELIV